MDNNICHIVYRWLSRSGIRVSRKLLTYRLSTHPEFPSIVSITDTLDDWGIPNAALVVDKEKIIELPIPFLVSTNSKGTQFQLVNKSQDFFETENSTNSNWNGIVLALERPADFNFEENIKRLQGEKKVQSLFTASMILAGTIAIAAFALSFNWVALSLLLLNLVGLVISILIVQQELGIDNSITKQICNAGKNTDCEAVLHSRESRIFEWLQFSDLGIIWFSSWSFILIALNFSTLFIQSLPLYSWISMVSLPLTLLSIYYQNFKIKKWCTLCLLTIGILWLQALILVSQGALHLSISLPEHVILIGLVFIITFSFWILMVRPLLETTNTLETEIFRLQRFRFDIQVFENALYSSKSIDTTVWPNELQLGNPASPIQILVACNPYCNPCAKAHDILHNLVEKIDIGLTVRFTLKVATNDRMTNAVEYLVRLLKDKPTSYKKMALHRWFRLMNQELYEKEYPLQHTADVTNNLKRYEQWTKDTGIKYTPTIFINGHILPQAYSVDDLPILISRILNKNETISETKNEEQLIQS